MKYNNEDEVKIVRYLRFRNNDPKNSLNTYMPLAPIAKFLNKSTYYIRMICKNLKHEVKPKNTNMIQSDVKKSSLK